MFQKQAAKKYQILLKFILLIFRITFAQDYHIKTFVGITTFVRIYYFDLRVGK